MQDVFLSAGVNQNARREETNRQNERSLRNRLQLRRCDERRRVTRKPACGCISRPAKNPYEQMPFAKGAKYQNAGGQHQEGGRLLGGDPRGGDVPDRMGVQKEKVHCYSLRERSSCNITPQPLTDRFSASLWLLSEP